MTLAVAYACTAVSAVVYAVAVPSPKLNLCLITPATPEGAGVALKSTLAPTGMQPITGLYTPGLVSTSASSVTLARHSLGGDLLALELDPQRALDVRAVHGDVRLANCRRIREGSGSWTELVPSRRISIGPDALAVRHTQTLVAHVAGVPNTGVSAATFAPLGSWNVYSWSLALEGCPLGLTLLPS